MKPIELTEEELVSGDRCLELGIPWVTEGAILKLDEILNDKDMVMEYGSGGSTLFFSNRCKRVLSYETSNDFFWIVKEKMVEIGIENVWYLNIEKEDALCAPFKKKDLDEVTVFSVDTQGGYNRSRILNNFLRFGTPLKLRIIILDNYAHPELFPDHYNKDNFMGDGWEVFTYDHERWAGDGTKILIKKQTP